jgi:hypothetical protein
MTSVSKMFSLYAKQKGRCASCGNNLMAEEMCSFVHTYKEKVTAVTCYQCKIILHASYNNSELLKSIAKFLMDQDDVA